METENNTNAKVMGGIVLIGGLAALWYLFFRNENKTLSGSDGAANELLMFIGERYPGKKVTQELISKAAKEYTKEFGEMEGTEFQWSKLFPRNVRKKVLVKTSGGAIVKILGQEVREGTKEWKKLVERKRLFDQHPRNEQ